MWTWHLTTQLLSLWLKNKVLMFLFLGKLVCCEEQHLYFPPFCLFVFFPFDYTAEYHWTPRKKKQKTKTKCLCRCHILKVLWKGELPLWHTAQKHNNDTKKKPTRLMAVWWFNTRWGCCQRNALMWAVMISVAFPSASDVTQRHKVQMCRRRLTQVAEKSGTVQYMTSATQLSVAAAAETIWRQWGWTLGLCRNNRRLRNPFLKKWFQEGGKKEKKEYNISRMM